MVIRLEKQVEPSGLIPEYPLRVEMAEHKESCATLTVASGSTRWPWKKKCAASRRIAVHVKRKNLVLQIDVPHPDF